MSGAPHSLQNLAVTLNCGAARATEQPRRGQSTATIPAGVHVGIVSPLVSDVRRIAVPSPTRSFETLVWGLALNRSAHRLDQVSRLLAPEDGVGSVVEVVEQVLDLGTGVERFVAVVFLVPVAPVQRP